MPDRSTASFIADKRQKWIDELRREMACHLAQSKAIVWKWNDVRSRTVLGIQEKSKDSDTTQKILQETAYSFFSEDGQRDREHEARHIRIKVRLTPKENFHIELRRYLDDIRIVLDRAQGTKIKTKSKSQLMIFML